MRDDDLSHLLDDFPWHRNTTHETANEKRRLISQVYNVVTAWYTNPTTYAICHIVYVVLNALDKYIISYGIINVKAKSHFRQTEIYS